MFPVRALGLVRFIMILLTVICLMSGVSLVQAGDGPERKVIAKLNILPGEEARFQALFEAFEEKTGIKVEHRQAPGSMIDKWAGDLCRGGGWSVAGSDYRQIGFCRSGRYRSYRSA